MSATPQTTTSPPLVRFSGEPAEVVGRVLDGRYRIEGVLGRGAMAVVLAARHLFLDARVAVKILHPGLTALPEMRARFLREARVTSGVAHDGLVRVSDFGVTKEGLHYLVMEQLEGEDLLTWSSRRGQADAESCARIAIAVCEALTALHAAGYVHRDLKPENLWVLPGADPARAPTVKVLDLGIAGLIEDAGDARIGRHQIEDKRLTQAGQTLGTALYMSPEQTMGNPLDARSDLYALGCVLWELATDQCAFEGASTMDIMMKQVSVVPAAPSTLNPTLPAWFDRLVLKLLAKRPEDRFQSAAETARAFAAELVGTGPTRAVGPSTPVVHHGITLPADEPMPRDRRWLWASLGVAALAATLTVLVQARQVPVGPMRARAVSTWSAASIAGPEFLLAEAGPGDEPAPAAIVPEEPPAHERDATAPSTPIAKPDEPVPVKTLSRPRRPRPTPEPTGPTDGLWQPARPDGAP